MKPGLSIDEPAYFDRLSDVETRHWWSRGVWRLGAYWLDSVLKGRTGLIALDVGCGTGQTALRLWEREEIEGVVGLEPSVDALCHARGKHPFPLVRGNALGLPFHDHAFDLVTCFDVFQHIGINADLRAAREIDRVLKPGGFALIRANGRGWTGDDSTYSLDRLVGVIEAAGLLVSRATLANALPAMAQEVRGAIGRCRRLDRDDVDPRSGGHPSGGGLQIQVPPAPINRLLGVVSGAEAWVAGRLGIPLPFGHSTLVLAESRG